MGTNKQHKSLPYTRIDKWKDKSYVHSELVKLCFDLVTLVNCTFNGNFCGWRSLSLSPDQVSWKKAGNKTGQNGDFAGEKSLSKGVIFLLNSKRFWS